MKNSFSWIVRGALAAGVVAYAAIGDPLFDALVAVQSLELSADAETESGHEDQSDPESTASGKSRLVQQQGGGRFGREYQDESSFSHQRNQRATLRAFRESVGDKWKSTVQILDKNRQVALGAIVAQDGWIVTKSSEISNRIIEVKLFDGTKAEASVKYRRNDFDLALLKIERKDLPAIQWSTSSVMRLGGWLATTDIRNLPIAIGVMSVTNRSVKREPARLGVELSSSDGVGGALVDRVTLGSGADRAGLQAGDVITAIDGDTLHSQPEVMSRLRGLMAGQRVDVGIVRNGKKSLLTAQMMDLTNALLTDPTEMEVNGEISSRSTGFQNIMQHDSVIAPNQCGGPIVDVFGNAVGLNIARAGRVSSYAIPASILSPVVADMIASAAGLTSPFEESVAQSSTKESAQRTSVALPASIPNSISVELLKPEVAVPSVGKP